MRITKALRRRIKIIVTCLSVAMALYVGISILGAAATMQLPRLPLKSSPAFVGLTFQDVAFKSRVDTIPLKG